MNDHSPTYLPSKSRYKRTHYQIALRIGFYFKRKRERASERGGREREERRHIYV